MKSRFFVNWWRRVDTGEKINCESFFEALSYFHELYEQKNAGWLFFLLKSFEWEKSELYPTLSLFPSSDVAIAIRW